MKKLLVTIILLATTSSYSANNSADNGTGRVVIHAKGCTEYLYATEQEHFDSALEEYRYNVLNKCVQYGYVNWTTLVKKWESGGINIKFHCLKGTVWCHD